MTAPNLPTEHEENNFFDAIERELVALTTAKLEEKPVSRAPMALPPPFSPKTVKPAQAGNHAGYACTVTHARHGSRLSMA